MSRLGWLLLVAGCTPKIDRGPVRAEAAEVYRVVELADDRSPNVYLQAIVSSGSAYDPPGQEGVAHLTASAMADGGAGARSSTEVREALYPTGNDLEVIVDREWTSFRLRCHRDHAALCIELFADVIVAPRFDAGDVLRLREDALFAVTDGILDDEEALAHEVFEAAVYDGHPYGHPIEGRAGALEVLDRDDLVTHHGRRFARETVIFGIAGGFGADDVAALKARIAPLPAIITTDLALFAPPANSGRTLVAVDTGTPVTGYWLGHPIELDRNHADWPALHVAMTAFGAHRQSFGRLFRTMRTARGLNYGDYAYVENFVQRGWDAVPENGVLRRQSSFAIWIRPTSTENGPFSLKLALAELDDLVAQGLTAEEVEDTKMHLASAIPLLAQDPGRRLAFELDAIATGTPNFLTAMPERIAALDEATIDAAIARHVRPADLMVAAVSGEADVLAASLRSADATPIVYADVVPDEAQAARDGEVAARTLGFGEDRVTVRPADGFFR